MASLLGNMNAWKRLTEAQKRKIKSTATEYVHRRVTLILKAAIKATPQFSGNYAANWQLATTKSGPGNYIPHVFRPKGYEWQKVPQSMRRHQGHEAALKHNLSQYHDKAWLRDNVHWNSNVKLVNHSPQADLHEAGQINLRPVNLVPVSETVMTYLKMKFKELQ